LEPDVNEQRKSWLIGAVIVVVVASLGFGVYHLLSGKSSGVRKPPKISLIPMTPPPKKPEPPKEQKDVKEVPQAPPKNAPPAPPSQELKMDGPAGDGPSAFSAGKITSEDLSNIGKPGGGGGEPEPPKGMFNPFTNYATLLKGELQRFLAKNKDLRQRAYKVEVRVWVNASGNLIRHELVGSAGDAELDESIRQALGSLGALSDVPPEKMPMPIRLRLTAGGH
jgi:protein TonB